MREAGRDVYDGLEIGVDVVRNSWARPLHRQTSHRKANVNGYQDPPIDGGRGGSSHAWSA